MSVHKETASPSEVDRDCIEMIKEVIELGEIITVHAEGSLSDSLDSVCIFSDYDSSEDLIKTVKSPDSFYIFWSNEGLEMLLNSGGGSFEGSSSDDSIWVPKWLGDNFDLAGISDGNKKEEIFNEDGVLIDVTLGELSYVESNEVPYGITAFNAYANPKTEAELLVALGKFYDEVSTVLDGLGDFKDRDNFINSSYIRLKDKIAKRFSAIQETIGSEVLEKVNNIVGSAAEELERKDQERLNYIENFPEPDIADGFEGLFKYDLMHQPYSQVNEIKGDTVSLYRILLRRGIDLKYPVIRMHYAHAGLVSASDGLQLELLTANGKYVHGKDYDTSQRTSVGSTHSDVLTTMERRRKAGVIYPEFLHDGTLDLPDSRFIMSETSNGNIYVLLNTSHMQDRFKDMSKEEASIYYSIFLDCMDRYKVTILIGLDVDEAMEDHMVKELIIGAVEHRILSRPVDAKKTSQDLEIRRAIRERLHLTAGIVDDPEKGKL